MLRPRLDTVSRRFTARSGRMLTLSVDLGGTALTWTSVFQKDAGRKGNLRGPLFGC